MLINKNSIMKVVLSKKLFISFSGIFLFLVCFLLINPAVHSQVVNESTKKKVSVGIGIYDDIMMNVPSGIKTRIINQGVHVYALYNLPFGKSIYGFSIGLGVSTHNVFGNFLVNKSGDSTVLVKIPDAVGYKRSKIALAYLEVPFEFNIKTKGKFQAALGFKVGYMIGSKEVYVGDGGITTFNFSSSTPTKIRVKSLGVPNVDQFAYGPTLRVGYKWIALDCYYMLSTIFTKDHGPDIYPVSVGIAIVPF